MQIHLIILKTQKLNKIFIIKEKKMGVSVFGESEHYIFDIFL